MSAGRVHHFQMRRAATGAAAAVVAAGVITGAPSAFGAHLAAGPAAGTYTPPQPADLSALSWTQAFDALHTKLAAEYAFTKWKHLDWSALYATYQPRIAAAEANNDAQAYYLALRAYVHETHDGHVHITDVPQVAEALAGGGFGLIVNRLEDGPVSATWVGRNGPARAAGLRKGARILKWDGTPIDKALQRTSTVLAPNQATTARVRYEQLRYLVRAPIGTQMTVRFRNPGGGRRTATLTAVDDHQKTLKMTSQSSRLSRGEIPTKMITTKVLSGRIGYMNIFAEIDLPPQWPGDHTPTLTQFRQAIRSFKRRGVERLVIDLRGNAGGSDQMVADFLASFYTRKHFYEYQNYIVPGTGRFEIWRADDKTGQYLYPDEGIWIKPGAPRFSGPVVALIDNACISSCEGVAMGIRNLTNGRTVGFWGTNGSFGMTGDGVLMPLDLEVGWPFGQSLDRQKVVQIDSRNGKGGILPEVWIPRSQKHLARTLSGHDVTLQHGLRVLRRMDS